MKPTMIRFLLNFADLAQEALEITIYSALLILAPPLYFQVALKELNEGNSLSPALNLAIVGVVFLLFACVVLAMFSWINMMGKSLPPTEPLAYRIPRYALIFTLTFACVASYIIGAVPDYFAVGVVFVVGWAILDPTAYQLARIPNPFDYLINLTRRPELDQA